MKEKLGGLEEEVKELFSRRLRKKLTGVTESVSSEKRFLLMF